MSRLKKSTRLVPIVPMATMIVANNADQPTNEVISAAKPIDDDEEDSDESDDDDVVKLTKKEKHPKKNKPGRPRKNPIRQPQKRVGLVESPADERNHVEFLYDNPEKFKKILSYFKSHAVNKVFIKFQQNSIIFWCEDSSQKNRIRVKINCNLVNHYYCPEPLNIGISCDHLEKIMATIDKTYNSILILSQRDSLQNYIQIILKDDSCTDESYKIELIEDYNTFQAIDHAFDEQEQYMLHFVLPSKKFKSMINNMSAFTNQVSIELHSATDPILFQYLSRDNKIKHTTTIRNNAFTLRQNLDENDTFHTSFILDYVKSISSSLISDTIAIYADENRPLLFINEMDNHCIEVRTLTNIVDKRYIAES